jgi:hypothetical protein
MFFQETFAYIILGFGGMIRFYGNDSLRQMLRYKRISGIRTDLKDAADSHRNR